jgi:hypothetical protein
MASKKGHSQHLLSAAATAAMTIVTIARPKNGLRYIVHLKKPRVMSILLQSCHVAIRRDSRVKNVLDGLTYPFAKVGCWKDRAKLDDADAAANVSVQNLGRLLYDSYQGMGCERVMIVLHVTHRVKMCRPY